MFVSTRQLHRILCGSDTGLSTDVSMYINEQESSHSGLRGGGGVLHPQYLACRHICRIPKVFINVLLLIQLEESLLCRQNGLERSLFVGKLGSNEVCLSAKWVRTKSACRQNGLERSLFVGKLGLRTPVAIVVSFASVNEY